LSDKRIEKRRKNMATIEVLAYFPKDITKFIEFCVKGAPGQTPQGGEKTGVFNWLHSFENVVSAHFFCNDPGPLVNLFVATVERVPKPSYPGPITQPIPWLGKIPGIEDFISTDGGIGMVTAFPSLNQLLATVKARPDLDQQFAAKQHALQGFDPTKLSVGEKGLIAALRGEPGTDLQAVFAEVKDKYNLSL
jgi:hypothetical protein